MEMTDRRIEIFAPFGAAFELMKKILFQPFDLAKWFVIGFAAFISGSWGGGFNPFGGNFNTRSRALTHGLPGTTDHFPAWAIPLILIGAVILIAFVFVLIWIVSRGRFVFTDCIVRNRAAIAEPWREYRKEGNSYFFFSLGLGLAVIALMAVLGIVFLVPMGLLSHWHGDSENSFSVGMVFVVVLLFLIWMALAVYLGLVAQLMVPVMYRRRCLAMEAFHDVSRLVLRHVGIFVLFVLFCVVLVIALTIVSTIIMCATCCIGALPYISSVLLLPAFVWLRGFVLCFLRQFGPDYDVWAIELPPSPTEPPPPTAMPPSLPA